MREKSITQGEVKIVNNQMRAYSLSILLKMIIKINKFTKTKRYVTIYLKSVILKTFSVIPINWTYNFE